MGWESISNGFGVNQQWGWCQSAIDLVPMSNGFGENPNWVGVNEQYSWGKHVSVCSYG